MRSLAFLAALTIACAHGDDDAHTSPQPADTGVLHVDEDANTANDRATPLTCAEAADAKSYVGCDFWPTVVANSVWSIFDYAVIVANTGDVDAVVNVTGNGVAREVVVRASGLAKIYLPWQAQLKGPDADACGRATHMPGSVRVNGGAYHLVSSRPVSVVQFNALEYVGDGGPEDKDWDHCPGSQMCEASGSAVGCLSFSNDASLLLPTTALTGRYRVAGIHGWSHPDAAGGPDVHVTGSYVTITATENGTHVSVKTSAHGAVLPGPGVPAVAANGTLDLVMNAGDVAELVSPADADADPSGGFVSADRPVQVIAGAPCIPMPYGKGTCDHVEESVFPAETLGKDYVVTAPTTPDGRAAGRIVRLYGNVDDTHLAWAPVAPPGAPTSLHAGEVVELPVLDRDVRVTGDHEFAVATFMLSGELVDPYGRGDPSMSMIPAVEQFRRRYVFLAPDDYSMSFVDVVLPNGATVLLDGAPQTQTMPIGETGFSVARLALQRWTGGTHEIVATEPVGMQVIGYGAYTTYEYPGGLDLARIATPPAR